MDAQTLRAETFKALHERDRAFVMPNPWDAGSAVMLASLGFEALATTSAGYAFSLARPDAEGALSLEDTLINASMIAKATALPVSADLENGFSDTPKGCAQTILRAAATGIVGGSIEDATGIASIRRLQAYAEAGADVLYAPALRSAEEVLAVVKAVAPKPVNVLMSGGLNLSVAQLSAMGVRRISVGSALALAAYGEFYRAAQEVYELGTFTFTERKMPFRQANQFFKG
ncbi:2-methylisocitrate lyase [Pseudomonas sp. NZIPFR-PS2]|nr:2-methylisocitrate lyase [Pseudomonas sp. NZIPFR-PS2]